MKVAVYIGNRYGQMAPSDINNRNKWHETDLMLERSEVIKAVAFGKTDTDLSEIGTVMYIENVNNLVGQLLTQADATFSDVDQRKAYKDITTNMVWTWFHSQETRMSAADASKMPSWDKSGGSDQ